MKTKAKSKKKEPVVIVDEILWCVREKNPDGRWSWLHFTESYTRQNSIERWIRAEHGECTNRDWIRERKAGRVACKKIKIVEVD